MSINVANLWKVTFEAKGKVQTIHVTANGGSDSLTADVVDWLSFAVFTRVNKAGMRLTQQAFSNLPVHDRRQRVSRLGNLDKVKLLSAEYIGPVLS